MIFPRFHGHRLRARRPCFELGVGVIARCQMPTDSIIEHVDSFEHVLPRVFACPIALMMHVFRFQRMKDTFHDRIVPAVSMPTHAHHQFVAGQQLAVPSGGVLKPAIRMMHHAARRSSVFHGHGERRCGQLPFVRLAPSLAGDSGNWITGDFLLPAP